MRGAQILAWSVIMVVDFRVGGSFFRGRGDVLLAQRLAFEREAMTAMHDAVEDGVGQGRIVEVGVPMFNWQLTGDQGGFAGGAIVEQFEQVVAFGLADRGESPIVD